MLAPEPSPQSTCAWLFSHARQRPDAVAISSGQTRISYRDLVCHVARTMDALTAAGIRADMVVGVEADDRLLHMLLLLGCEALGVTTISLLPAELEPPLNRGNLCDRILASQPLSGSDANKTLVMTRDWILQHLHVSIVSPRLEALKYEPNPNSLVRLIKSSGTTGVPKVMGMTHQVWQRSIRMDINLILHRNGLHPRFLCLYPFTVRSCHRLAWATLQFGGTVQLGDMTTAWNLISSGMVNCGLFITGDLERIVQAAPSGVGPFAFHIKVVGSAVSASLRQETQRKLAETVQATYGSNETAYVSFVDENGVGTLLPGVQIKICDPSGNLLPLGQSGLIRIKSDMMATGYIDAPDLSRKTFIDGWFHTNDLGYQPSSNELVVQGRADDVLNIGGIKIAAGRLVEEIRAVPGIRDALVIQVLNAAQIGVLVVAVETGPGGGPDDLPSLITPVVQQFSSAYELLRMEVFARTETGKIRREAIRDAYQQSIAGSKSASIAQSGAKTTPGLASGQIPKEASLSSIGSAH